MNKSMKKMGSRLLALGICLLTSLTAQAAVTEIHLRTGIITNTMPDGRAVVMWGFAQDSAPGVDDGAVIVPGPAIVLTNDLEDLVIHLENTLPEPVSIVIPGLASTALGNPERNTDGRARSFTHEAAPGGTADYRWNAVKAGTYLYHSGSHPAVQVQMGLYGSLTKLETTNQAYAGVLAHDSELTLLFSAVDPALHDAVAAGEYGPGMNMSSTIKYAPRYFFINGRSYVPGLETNTAEHILAGAIRNDGTSPTILLRFLNADIDYHVPVLGGMHLTFIAEDAFPYPQPRKLYAGMLQPLKTRDAFWQPSVGGTFALYDRRLDLVTGTNSPGGMLAFVQVTGVTNPVIGVSPAGFAENVAQGSDGTPQDMIVWNAGSGTLNYNISSDSAWLAVSPGAGSSAGEVNTHTVTYSTASLAAGMYTGTITVADSAALNSPQTVTVILTVSALPPPQIGLAPTTLTPTTPVGIDPAAQSMTVWNAGSSTLNYDISSDSAWLAVSPGVGSSAGETNTHTVTYSTAALAAGTYTGTITVADSAAPNSSQTAVVVLQITAAPSFSNLINCGGGATNGWSADTGFLGGSTYSTTAAIANAGIVPQAIYQSERWGNPLDYSFPDVSNGTYEVRLHFAEIWFNENGRRIFDVDIEGLRVLTNFDIHAEAGGSFIALVLPFEITVSDGNGLQIQGRASVDDAKFSGIEIVPMGPPTPALIVNPTSVTIPEDSWNSFTVALNSQPAGDVTVSVSRVTGDTDINVASGALLTFGPATWNVPQTVVLTAAEDADALDGLATIACAASGYAAVEVTAMEADNDAPVFAGIAVNSGGPAVNGWIADTGFIGGSAYSITRPIANAGDTPQSVYQSERWGTPLNYSFPDVPDGTYSVKLHFAEIYFTVAGRRVFDVSIEGQRVLDDFDIFVEAGGRDRAIVKTFEVAVSDGNGLQITGLASVDDAKFSGIEIAASGPPIPVIVPSTTSLTIPEGSSNSFSVTLSSAPAGTVTVTVSRASGDTDITVAGGGTLIFTPANWSVPQTVVLSATEDADTLNGQALIALSDSGYMTAQVTATELDNDTQPGIPLPPSDLTIGAVTRTSIAMSWRDNSDNERGFGIQRSMNGITWARVGTAAANVTNFVNTGLTPNTRYWYRVYSYNTNGGSATCPPADGTTLP